VEMKWRGAHVGEAQARGRRAVGSSSVAAAAAAGPHALRQPGGRARQHAPAAGGATARSPRSICLSLVAGAGAAWSIWLLRLGQVLRLSAVSRQQLTSKLSSVVGNILTTFEPAQMATRGLSERSTAYRYSDGPCPCRCKATTAPGAPGARGNRWLICARASAQSAGRHPPGAACPAPARVEQTPDRQLF
jgi:hypothetical protein